MRTVRGWAAGISILLASLGATGAFAKPLTVNDVIRLNAAGVADETIMTEVIVTETVFDLSPDDIIRLSEVGITDDLIQFMIETGLADEGAPEEAATPAPQAEEAPVPSTGEYDDDDDSTSHFAVSLNYGYYGGWWYDPWYWDPWYCSYSPYYFSFSWGWGYPGWGYSPYCWSSYYPYGGYCGYGPYYGYAWSGCSAPYYGSYPVTGYGLSTTKYKTNGAGAALASNLATKELKVSDYSRTLAHAERTAPGVKSPAVRSYAKTGSKSLSDRVRPVRTSRPTRSVKAPRSVDAPVKYAEVAPDRVREPADGSRPTKVTRAAASDVDGKAVESKAVEPRSNSKSPGTRTKSTIVRPGTRSSKSSSPAVRSAPATRSAPASKSSSVRSAPASKSSHAVRSAPSRSAPTRSVGASRSAPSFRSAPMRSSSVGRGGFSGGGRGGRGR